MVSAALGVCVCPGVPAAPGGLGTARENPANAAGVAGGETPDGAAVGVVAAGRVDDAAPASARRAATCCVHSFTTSTRSRFARERNSFRVQAPIDGGDGEAHETGRDSEARGDQSLKTLNVTYDARRPTVLETVNQSMFRPISLGLTKVLPIVASNQRSILLYYQLGQPSAS